MEEEKKHDKTISLTIAHLRPSMILAEDAINNIGVTVLSKNIKLDNINFDRLKRNQVVHVVVWENSIDENQETFITSIIDNKKDSNSIIKSKEFKRFYEAYKQKMNEFKNCLSAIEKGEKIDIDPLYSIIDGIMGIANCKSDLISYVSYLNGLDDFTYRHSINVAIYCNILGYWINMDNDDIKIVSVAGLLHDIGKSKISKSIIQKIHRFSEKSLNEKELMELKKHPQYGYDMIKNQDIDEEIKNAILMHHEKIDGCGYPQGIKDNDISSFAKMVAICDSYDLMIDREKMSPLIAINNFKSCNYGILDTEYLIKFTENIVYSYIGTEINLSNGKSAKVVYINGKQPNEPIVVVDNKYLDLSQEKDIFIK